MRTLIIFNLLFLLSGCSTPPPVRQEVDQSSLLLKFPESLPLLTDGTGRDIVLTMREWASMYHECRIRHNGLVDAVVSGDGED